MAFGNPYAQQQQGQFPAQTNNTPTMPLSPYFEQGRRNLEDQYQQSLAQIGAARSQVQPTFNLAYARLNTDQGVDHRRLKESMADRGIFNSGVTNTQRGLLFTGYDRQRQDLARDQQAQYSQLADQEAQARMAYYQGLQELLLAAAQMQAQDPNLATGYGENTSTAGLIDFTQFFNRSY